MRGRGLASALVHASHAAAHARGINRAFLQATALGRPVYTRAGYREGTAGCRLPIDATLSSEREMRRRDRLN
jgi:GNAT superfamily N-acetyltransferase